MKILWLLVVATIACKTFTGRWPWEWLGGTPASPKGVDQARTLLNVGRDASRDSIIEAHRRLIAVVHPDRGGSNEQVYEANAARDLLLARAPHTLEHP